MRDAENFSEKKKSSLGNKDLGVKGSAGAQRGPGTRVSRGSQTQRHLDTKHVVRRHFILRQRITPRCRKPSTGASLHEREGFAGETSQTLCWALRTPQAFWWLREEGGPGPQAPAPRGQPRVPSRVSREGSLGEQLGQTDEG